MYHAGEHFNVNATWWNQSGPMLAYFSRCCYLLQQGLPAAEAKGLPGPAVLLVLHVQDVEQPVGPLPAEDEVGMLVGSFNSMVLRLRERDEELQATVRRLDTVLGAVRTGVLTLDAGRSRVRGNPGQDAKGVGTP